VPAFCNQNPHCHPPSTPQPLPRDKGWVLGFLLSATADPRHRRVLRAACPVFSACYHAILGLPSLRHFSPLSRVDPDVGCVARSTTGTLPGKLALVTSENSGFGVIFADALFSPKASLGRLTDAGEFVTLPRKRSGLSSCTPANAFSARSRFSQGSVTQEIGARKNPPESCGTSGGLRLHW
jgi:hypothetical protein